MSIRLAQFIAIISTALALVRTGAHLMEMASKLSLERDQYFIVQQIYRGWAFAGIILIFAALTNILVAVRSRSAPVSAVCAAIAACLICVTLGIFFAWTRPANEVTNNWSVVVTNWEALRARWEWSHAVNAVLTFLALCSTTAGSLLWSQPALVPVCAGSSLLRSGSCDGDKVPA